MKDNEKATSKVFSTDFAFFLFNCIEPFEPEAVDYKSAIVIEATITDEYKNQEIVVSRTFALDTTGPYRESGAKVQITDTNGAVHGFEEKVEGAYISQTPFEAETGVGYILSVIASDGTTYKSTQVRTPSPTKIDSIYAKRDVKDDGASEGMFIYIDTYDPTGSNTYYRYKYEETHKIIAPFWTNMESYIIDNAIDLVGLRLRDREEQVCYRTNGSKDLILANTVQFLENRISKFPIRFIDRNDYILSHRYSILVKQYAQSLEAHTFYKVLNKLSGSDNMFSQVQTGFLEVNISSLDNNEEQVIGFFEVSTISEKGLFFSYFDFFNGEPRPPYIIECPFLWYLDAFVSDIKREATAYWDDNNGQYGQFLKPAPYIFVPVGCGDCNVYGSNIVPDFWVEE